MVKCPYCNSPMENIPEEEYNGFADMYYCQNCRLEQAIPWNSGERIVSERPVEE